MRVLTFTSLYPNVINPRHGIFVKNRMEHFDQIPGNSRKVIAPVQYFPLLGLNKKSKFHLFNKIPQQERQGNIHVFHPRYLTIPGSHLINVADAMLRAAEKTLPVAYPDDETFDLVDAHYLYPDGITAYKLAKKHKKPLFLTARGSDVNYWMEQEKHRKDILEAINYAHKVICVSQALKDRLIQFGIKEAKLIVLRNGVDRALFNPETKAGPVKGYWLTVGNLVPLKGHQFILEALQKFPEEKLIIIGSGELESSLKAKAEALGILHQVSFLTQIPHDQLPPFYAGAKGLILMSSMEGMPNVILESLACGIPVIATAVGGIPEVITPENGILLRGRTTDDLCQALKQALQQNWDRSQIAKTADTLDWQASTRQLQALFSAAL